MKTQLINRIAFLFILMLSWMTVRGQQQWEVPGDNFSLEGALEIFKKSASPEELERRLNDPETRVNNLDLNGDGYIDYIRVIDMYEGNVHVFVLQAVISDMQSQDVAVITLEKRANGRAILQITGDADIYGVETIIEPTTEVRTYAGVNTSRVVVNVWSWPLVRYIYGPYYSVWVSPWGWSYRPGWWRPWRPVVYYDYYAFWRPFRSYYSVCYTHRVVYAHEIYRPYRTTSVIVHKRHHHRINEYRSTRIDRQGQYQPHDGRSPSRRTDVRYNSDGRIVSNSNGRISTGSSSRSSIGKRESSERRESENAIQGSMDNSRRYSENYNDTRRSSEGTNSDANMRRSDRSSNIQQSTERSAGNTDLRRSSGNSSMQRSDVKSNHGANYRRENNSGNVQRSPGRSYGNPDIQRSQQRSGSSS
ncbi:MAG: hypothetical protein KFF73_02140, partial [Cyclobacteriaceae bacterium]|nr:hypothetical protein [Cyclobacteriaceae bacterium]